MTLKKVILDLVKSRQTPLTIPQVVATVGGCITLVQAATAGRRCIRQVRKRRASKTTRDADLVSRGRRHLVASALSDLARAGKICRTGIGLYSRVSQRSLYEAVSVAVNSRPESTSSQVLADVTDDIPTSQAAMVGRRERRRKKRARDLVAVGRRQLVNDALSQLYRLGRIRRVRQGVYAPLLPRLFGETA